MQWFYSKSVKIQYTEHFTNETVSEHVGKDRALAGRVKSRLASWNTSVIYLSRHTSSEYRNFQEWFLFLFPSISV